MGVLLKWVIVEHTGPTAPWTICLGALPSAILHVGGSGQGPWAGPGYPWTRGRGEISRSKVGKWQGRWQNGGICQKQEARGSCREENNSRTYCQSSKQGFLRALGKRKVKTIFPVMATWGRRCGTDFLRKLQNKDCLVINKQHIPSVRGKIVIVVQNGYTLYIRFAFERQAYPT